MDTNMKQLRDPEEIRQHIRDIYKENRFKIGRASCRERV